jgi:hypothetical protein
MVEKVLAPAGFGGVVRERAGRLWTGTEHKERAGPYFFGVMVWRGRLNKNSRPRSPVLVKSQNTC